MNTLILKKTFVVQLWGYLVLIPSLALAQTNVLTNPGFETGSASGWSASYGSYSVVNNNVHSGTYAARIGYASGVEQTVTGLSPNTEYTCTGWLKETTAGQRVYLIAQNFGGTAVNVSTTSGTYTYLSLTFTTGATNTSTQIAVYQSGTNFAYCDDLVLGGAGDASGIEASRIADCLERFGVNTFSKLYNNGFPWAWGGSKGSYDSTNTALAINYITAGSGLTINDREYHHDFGGSPPVAITPLQKAWIRAVHQATGSPFSIAIGSDSSTNYFPGATTDIPGIVALVQDSVTNGLNYVKWVEGINEPNNFGPVGSDTNAAVQAALFQQIHAITTNVIVMGPSIVFGFPFPDGWLSHYLGTNLASVLASSDVNNLHVYPPGSPNADDGSKRGGVLADVDAAFATVLPGKLAINTEWHPTLYSSIHKTNDLYDAYWGPIYLVSSYFDFDWQANFWFALFDYKATMPCGLFATSVADPKPVANAFRVLFKLTGDLGPNKLTFIPGKLDVTVSGLPPAPSTNAPFAGGRGALFENSTHQYFLMLWNEQNDISTNTTPVTVTFNSHNMAKVEEFNITSGSETALQTLTSVHAMTVNLNTSMRLLRITY